MQFQTEAQAIVDLCALSDTPNLVGEYNVRGLTQDQIRKELMAHRATGPEIHSHVLPGTGTHAQPTNLDANPVVTACRKLAQHHALGGT